MNSGFQKNSIPGYSTSQLSTIASAMAELLLSNLSEILRTEISSFPDLGTYPEEESCDPDQPESEPGSYWLRCKLSPMSWSVMSVCRGRGGHGASRLTRKACDAGLNLVDFWMEINDLVSEGYIAVDPIGPESWYTVTGVGERLCELRETVLDGCLEPE